MCEDLSSASLHSFPVTLLFCIPPSRWFTNAFSSFPGLCLTPTASHPEPLFPWASLACPSDLVHQVHGQASLIQPHQCPSLLIPHHHLLSFILALTEISARVRCTLPNPKYAYPLNYLVPIINSDNSAPNSSVWVGISSHHQVISNTRCVSYNWT